MILYICSVNFYTLKALQNKKSHAMVNDFTSCVGYILLLMGLRANHKDCPSNPKPLSDSTEDPG